MGKLRLPTKTSGNQDLATNDRIKLKDRRHEL